MLDSMAGKPLDSTSLDKTLKAIRPLVLNSI